MEPQTFIYQLIYINFQLSIDISWLIMRSVLVRLAHKRLAGQLAVCRKASTRIHVVYPIFIRYRHVLAMHRINTVFRSNENLVREVSIVFKEKYSGILWLIKVFILIFYYYILDKLCVCYICNFLIIKKCFFGLAGCITD